MKQVGKEFSLRKNPVERSSPLREIMFCLTLKITSYNYIALLYYVVKIFISGICGTLPYGHIVIPLK